MVQCKNSRFLSSSSPLETKDKRIENINPWCSTAPKISFHLSLSLNQCQNCCEIIPSSPTIKSPTLKKHPSDPSSQSPGSPNAQISMRDRLLLTESVATTIYGDSSNNQLKPPSSPPNTTNNDTKNGTSPTNANPYADVSPAFNSSMAVTILVLLTALFFMGFFSVYVRRLAEENSAEPVRRRRRAAATRARRASSLASGLDPNVIRSLPTFPHKTASSMDESDCAVCLFEFEQGDTVKLLPACSHLFHADCIDAWLASHTSCPLCRATLFPPPQKKPEERRETAAAEDPPEVGVLVVRVEGLPAAGEGLSGLRRCGSGCSLPRRIEPAEEAPARRSCSF